MMAISSIFSGQKNRKMCTQRKEGKENSQQRKSIPGRKKEPSVVLGTFPVLQVGLARHKQSHCAHSTQMMCEISIVKLTMEIDRSVSISGYSHSGAARTVIKLEVYWFVLTHSPGKNFPNEKVREKKRRLRLGGTPQIDCMQCSFSFLPFAPLLIAGCGRVFTPCWFAVVL